MIFREGGAICAPFFFDTQITNNALFVINDGLKAFDFSVRFAHLVFEALLCAFKLVFCDLFSSPGFLTLLLELFAFFVQVLQLIRKFADANELGIETCTGRCEQR